MNFLEIHYIHITKMLLSSIPVISDEEEELKPKNKINR